MLHLVFLAANPLDRTRLRLGAEAREVHSALEMTMRADAFRVDQAFAVRPRDLQALLLQHKPQIVHFSGHGQSSSRCVQGTKRASREMLPDEYDDDSPALATVGLVLEDDDGRAVVVRPEVLSELFALIKRDTPLQCVVLNACFTAEQAQAIAKHVDCVVGTSDALDDRSAMAFSVGFYRGIALGKSLATVFDLGCNEIALRSLPDRDVPQLFAREKAERIFLGAIGTFSVSSTGESFVTGLPSSHGWQRGMWVQLSVEKPGLSDRYPAAIAVVSEVLPTSTRVHVLYQRPSEKRLEGAQVRVIGRDERARLDQYVGTIVAIESDQAKIDLGSVDGVQERDEYEIRAGMGSEHSLGRLRIVRVEQLHAWAQIVEGQAQACAGQTAVWLQSATEAQKRPRAVAKIVVVNFDPADEHDPIEQKAGRVFAKDLARELQMAADVMGGVKVGYESKERVAVLASDDDGHAEARKLGKRLGADIVVWGAIRCDKRACAQPRFTVVDPPANSDYFRAAVTSNVWLDKNDAGFQLQPSDASGLAGAILGSVAYRIQRYGDAIVYLGRALAGPNPALKGENTFRAYTSLAYAQFVRGQVAAARETATTLVKIGETEGKPEWTMTGYNELARQEAREGRVAEARKHLQEVTTWAEANDDAEHLGYALHQLAVLEAQQGRVDEARNLYNLSLNLARRIGNVRGEAATLHQLATLEARQDRVDEARRLYNLSLEMKRRLGNIQGEAATLHTLAMLEVQLGQLEEARRLYNLSLEHSRRIGNEEGQCVTLLNLATIDDSTGKRAEARAAIEQALARACAIQHAEYQAACHEWLGRFDLDAGHIEFARTHWREALTLHEKLQMPDDIARLNAHLASLR